MSLFRVGLLVGACLVIGCADRDPVDTNGAPARDAGLEAMGVAEPATPDTGTVEPATPDTGTLDTGTPDTTTTEDATPEDATEDAAEDIATESDDRDATALPPPGIHLVAGFDPSLPYDDLVPFGQMAESAQVVALGEAVHTSGGFYAIKARLIRYLVEHKGFRVLAFETPRIDAESVENYVDTCAGTADDAVSGLYGVWQDTHVRDLVRWLCEYNTTNPSDPVAFFGFDASQPWDDARRLREFLDVADPTQADTLMNRVLVCDGASFDSATDYYRNNGWEQPIPQSDFNACLAALTGVRSYFETHETSLIAATSAERLAMARLNLVGLEEWEESKFADQQGDMATSFEARDRAMAEVFRVVSQVRHPGAKTVLWAHNLHIAAHHQEIDGSYNIGRPVTNMGSLLREQLGSLYQAYALTGYAISINWPGVEVGPLPVPTAPNATEVLLHALAEPYLFVDLATATSDGTVFTAGDSYELSNGSTWPDAMVLERQFSALLYLDESPAMDAVGW